MFTLNHFIWLIISIVIIIVSVVFLNNIFCTLSDYNNAGLTTGSIKYKWNKSMNLGKAANSI